MAITVAAFSSESEKLGADVSTVPDELKRIVRNPSELEIAIDELFRLPATLCIGYFLSSGKRIEYQQAVVEIGGKVPKRGKYDPDDFAD